MACLEETEMRTLTLHHPMHSREFYVYRASSPNCYVREKVMLITAHGKELGLAYIIGIDRVSLWEKSNHNIPKITEADAQNAGFKNLGHMRRIFAKRLDGITIPLYRIKLLKEGT